MEGLSFIGVFTVRLDGTWDELDVSHETLVRLLNQRHDNLLHLGCGLLTATLLLSVASVLLGRLVLLPTVVDLVVWGAGVPSDQLSIDATTDDDVGVFGAELQT